MNSVHLHLILVHFPIVLMPMAFVLLFVQLFKKNQPIDILARILLIVSAAITVPAYLLGEEAEEVSEKIPGVIESIIEGHADAAIISLCLVCLTAIISLLTFLKFTKINSLFPLSSLLIIMSFFSYWMI